MPTIFTHSIIGATGATFFKTPHSKVKFWILSLLCPIIPDFDVIGFKFGIAYGDFLGHRGFSHSFLFAFLLAGVISFVVFRKENGDFLKKFYLTLYFFAITASHGILDALTSGGLGIAFFSPFDTTRYFFPSTPIAVSPIGIQAFFSEWGLRVIISEIFWIWLPVGVVLLLGYGLRKITKSKNG